MKFLLPLLFLMGCAHKHCMGYRAQGQQVIEQIERGADSAAIRTASLQLMEEGISIAQRYLRGHPECRDYVERTIQHRERMLQLPLPELERLYHVGEALPEAPDHCYDVKDLIVHPATVVVLLQCEEIAPASCKQAREQMTSELEEVIDHFDNVMAEI